MHPELATALDELYKAFADYPAPRWVEACACCHEPEEGSPLHPEHRIVLLSAPGVGTPLREISAPELEWFADDVPLVAGSDADWKHYLPRILELAILDKDQEWVLQEIVIGHLVSGAETTWVDWPAHEARALRDTFHAYWRDLLCTPCDDDALRVDGALCAIGTVDPAFDWYLDEWASFSYPRCAGRLAEFLDLNSEKLFTGRLWNAFWEQQEDPGTTNGGRLLEWLRSDQLLDAVVAASALASDPEEMAAFDEIIVKLTRLGSR